MQTFSKTHFSSIFLTAFLFVQITLCIDDLSCSNLRLGQYYCAQPTIDSRTQQAKNCSKETRTVEVPCFPVSGLTCDGHQYNGSTVGFYQEVPCKWTSGQEFNTALLLSVFLGWCGVDRFYLGYPAIGLVKFATVGFMLLGTFVDILLIALQVVKPADESDYVIDYYGAVIEKIEFNNETYIKPPTYY